MPELSAQPSHFMLQEIKEQPQVIRQALTAYLQFSLKGDRLEWSGDSPIHLNLPHDFDQRCQHIRILACGSSFHAGLVGRYWLEQLAGIPTVVQQATDYCDLPSPLPPNTLLIGVTQSGETTDTLTALQQAQAQGHLQGDSFRLGIASQTGSALDQNVHQTLPSYAGREVSIAATKTFLAELVVFLLLALDWGFRRGWLTAERLQQLLVGLQQIPAQIQTVIETQTPQIQRIAERLRAAQSCICLSRGLNTAIALEGALKFKETCYLHAEGSSAGEWMHGPIALLDDRIPVIALAMPDANWEKLLENLSKVKARGASLMGIVSAQSPQLPDGWDEQIVIPATDIMLSPLLSVIPLQLLAYYSSLARGLDVDHPRNLQKFIKN